MGTVKRRRRNQRNALNDHQHEILMHGAALLFHEGPGFRDKHEMRQVWRRYRDVLLTEDTDPGSRPVAFFLFDLNIDPAPIFWQQQIAVLLEKNLIKRSEADDIEDVFDMLSPLQTLDFCSSYDSIETFDSVNRGRGAIDCHTLEQFQLAARWHIWRGRAEMALRWSRRAGVARLVMDTQRKAGINATD